MTRRTQTAVMDKGRARTGARVRARRASNRDQSSVSPGLYWVAALGLSSLLLVSLRMLFIMQHARIIDAAAPIDPARIVLWARWGVLDPDGVEMPLASAGMLMFIAGTAFLARFGVPMRHRAIAIAIGVIGFALAALTIAATQSTEIRPPSEPAAGTLLAIVGATLIWLTHLGATRATRPWRLAAVCCSAVILTLLVVLSLPYAAVVDYSYYIGPALKHMQGGRIGSYYMQYDLFGTLMFESMMRARLQLHQMQLVMALLLAAWFGLYWLLIRRLFEHRSIGVLLFVALVIVRFLDIQDHPTVTPQVLPHRLDMWVPLVLCCTYWGLDSLGASLAFAAAYAFDSAFGFLAAGTYVAALGFVLFHRPADGGFRQPLGRLAVRILPIVVVAIAQKLAFGSIVSPAASSYVDVKLGFMPISSTSLFWPIALLVGWAVATFVVHRDDPSSGWGLLICLFVASQLTYFFGRSHDHNLLNVSAVWLFAIFLAIDRARELGRFRVPIAGVLLLVSAVIGAKQSAHKFERIAEHVRGRTWITPHPIERGVEAYRAVATPNTMLLDLADAYINYRLALPQRGFFSPFNANVFVEQTALWLDDQIDAGVQLVTFDPAMAQAIGDLNRSVGLRARGHQFVGYDFASGFVGIRRAP